MLRKCFALQMLGKIERYKEHQAQTDQIASVLGTCDYVGFIVLR